MTSIKCRKCDLEAVQVDRDWQCPKCKTVLITAKGNATVTQQGGSITIKTG